MGFQSCIRRVWAPRFRVSGFSLAGLGSKVWVVRVVFGGYGLEGLGFQRKRVVTDYVIVIDCDICCCLMKFI